VTCCVAASSGSSIATVRSTVLFSSSDSTSTSYPPVSNSTKPESLTTGSSARSTSLGSSSAELEGPLRAAPTGNPCISKL
jgi:hypothetical protein